MSGAGERITAVKVQETERLKALPLYFGKPMIQIENAIYTTADRLSEDYDSGYWEFYVLSNDGFYLAPSEESLFSVSVHGNYFEGSMSADALGIVSCLYVYNQAIWNYQKQEEAAQIFYDLFMRLKDFAAEHEESHLIFGATD